MAVGSPMIAASLPTYIVVKSNFYSDKGYGYYKENAGGSNSVALGEASVFSTLVKIEVEHSTVSNSYVNLRFCYSNKFWTKGEDSKYVVADVDQPQEDVTKASCTLFQAFQVEGEEAAVYLVHVQSGGRLLIEEDGPTMAFYVEANPNDDQQGYLSLVDWNTLIKLPTTISFKGNNTKYLTNWTTPLDKSYLLFESDDPNELNSTHTVELQEDGHVRIKTNSSGYWVLNDTSDAYITATDYAQWHTEESDRLTGARDFWPVKIDENTVALRNKQSNCFCADDHSESPALLYATASSLKKEARLQLTELVMGRKVNNVRYLMEYARIYDEAPFVAGKDVLINDTNEEASLTAEVSYEDQKTYTFSHSTSLTAGVMTEFSCGVPFLAEGKIEVSFEINETLTWDQGKSNTIGATGSASIPVPPMTTTTVEYVGTKGTCNIPYTYTQEDQSSVDGRIVRTDMIDGIYNGVSYYNFNFHIISNQPIKP